MTLIKRLETAEQGSWELDAEILRHFGYEIRFVFADRFLAYPPHGEVATPARQSVTTSISAAVALVEKMLPGWEWAVGKDWAFLKEDGVDLSTVELDPDAICGTHNNSALALCIALLKAIEAKEGV